VAHINDVRTQASYLEGNPAVVAVADLAGARTLLIVPMLNEIAAGHPTCRSGIRPDTLRKKH
jgi:hypothetical protein